MKKRKLLFLTGTRADFGKLKPLINKVKESNSLEYDIFVTGMHTLKKYGYTVDEVYKAGFKNVHMFMNHVAEDPMEIILSNTIQGLSRYIKENKPDMLVVHGDRVEALAGAITGALNNILVCHIEGGEVSGTVDEIIRHAITKLAHIHFVANEQAYNRLIQLGERPDSIFIIGSPDIDIMLSNELPSLAQAKERYDVKFNEYGIALFHPVTTEIENFQKYASAFAESLIESNLNYIVIYPNNDEGCNFIFNAYEMFKRNERFRLFPSIRFEYFLTFLKNSNFIIGNSSCGIREAPIYSVPTLNIGTRQANRTFSDTIIHVNYEKKSILQGINKVMTVDRHSVPVYEFGNGKSSEKFIKILDGENIWNVPKQKQFVDLIALSK